MASLPWRLLFRPRPTARSGTLFFDLRQSARRRESSIIRAHDLPEPDTPEGDTAFRTDSEFNP